MNVNKQERNRYTASNYTEHAFTRLKPQSWRPVWFILVDPFSMVRGHARLPESRQGPKCARLIIGSHEPLLVFNCKCLWSSMTVRHRPVVHRQHSTNRKSLFLCITHIEMKRILMKTRWRAACLVFLQAVINSDSHFNIIIWEFLI